MTTILDFHQEYFGMVEGDRHYTLQELLQFAEKYSHQARGVKLSTAIADKYQIREVEMFSRSRKREIVNARQLYAALLKDCTKATLAAIGKEVGLDHSTIIHSCKTVLDYYDTERAYRQRYIDLKWLISTGKITLPWYGITKAIDPNAAPDFTPEEWIELEPIGNGKIEAGERVMYESSLVDALQ